MKKHYFGEMGFCLVVHLLISH